MATLEVTLKYRPPLARFAFRVITVLAPFWLGIPFLLFILPLIGLGGLLSHLFGNQELPLGSSVLMMCGPGIIVGLTAWLFARDNKVVISQQGICMPSSLNLQLWGRRNRPWYDLKRINFSTTGLRFSQYGLKDENILHKSLVMEFSSGGAVRIDLKDLALTEVEQLILAIETFAPSVENHNLLSTAKQQLGETLKIAGIKSYTNLWEDELRYRYSSTTFIPLPPGQKLQDGDIKVIRQLGFGGLSAIYLVQRSGKDLYVLKESTVPADVEDEMKSKAIEMFDREAKILAQLNHPKIAKVYDHFVENNRHYLLLQYIHGEDLRQHVKEHGAMNQDAVIASAVQVAEILEYLHNGNPAVIHRDLTPENLVINDNGKIVLIDFGAANEFLQTATGTLVGKHAYIAPEQFRGKATTGSDLYSLGGTIHFLLTGSDPIALSSSSPRKVVPSISPELDELVIALTKASVKERVESASEAKRRLEALLPIARGLT